MKEIKEDHVQLLNTYTEILDGCRIKLAKDFLITRIYKILRRYYKERNPKDFPNQPYDLQVVHLVAHLKQNSMPYAFLFASSLYSMIKVNKPKEQLSIWSWLKQLTKGWLRG